MVLPSVNRGRDFLHDHGLYPEAPEVLDASMVGTYAECPSKFYLRYVLGLVRKYARSSGLDWGTAWHEVMFTYGQLRDLPIDERMIKTIQRLDEVYPAYITADTDRHHRSKQRMIEILFAYHERWAQREAEYTILRNEQYFNVDHNDLKWCGRIDRIIRVNRNNKIRVWDFKTASVMGKSYFDQFEISFQFPGYVWAANVLSTEPVWEITVDVLYCLSKSYEFFERTFRYDQFRLREWYENVKRITDEIYYKLEHHLYDPEAWTKSWNACQGKYGTCSFFGTHSLNPRGVGRLYDLRDNYHMQRWDPAASADEN